MSREVLQQERPAPPVRTPFRRTGQLEEVRAVCRRCGSHTQAVVSLHALSGSCGNCGACDLELIGV